MAAAPFADIFPDRYEPNELTRLVAEQRAAGQRMIDLTESNPAAVGLSPDPVRLAPALSAGANGYRPQPCGAPEARAAVAACYRERGVAVPPERVVLTASTSEAYGWLFKLLCGAGDRVLVPVPGYPLCADLAHLERVGVCPYRLQPGPGGWRPDRAEVTAGLRRGARAVVAISPHNPTGACLTAGDARWLGEACAEHGAALIVDEVFGDYPWAGHAAAPPAADGDAPALTFLLGGLSKMLALPQLKCGWIAVTGPRALAAAAMEHLEFLADAYLPVNGMVQAALPDLLACRRQVQRPIVTRVRANIATLRAAGLPAACSPAAGSGGWWWLQPLGGIGAARAAAAEVDDADFAAVLLRERGVLIHPGYLFDARQPSVALSLIVPPPMFAAGVAHLAAALEKRG
jgi:hypothetical protein